MKEKIQITQDEIDFLGSIQTEVGRCRDEKNQGTFVLEALQYVKRLLHYSSVAIWSQP